MVPRCPLRHPFVFGGNMLLGHDLQSATIRPQSWKRGNVKARQGIVPAITGGRMWLKVRIGNGLSSEEEQLKTQFLDRTLTISNENKGKPLSRANWLVFAARGFADEEEARTYGEELRQAVHLAGLANMLGVDGRASGDDQELGAFNEDWARQEGLLAPHQRYAPDVHGILTMPDDEDTLFPRMSAAVTVTSDPDGFLRAIEQSKPSGDCPRIRRAIRVLNLSLINEEPIAKIVLAISAIEALALDEAWTGRQQDLIEWVMEQIRSAYGEEEGSEAVVQALRYMHKGTIRQKVKRLLLKHGLNHLLREWDAVYSRRSQLFHGQRNVDDLSLSTISNQTIKLCGSIVLLIAERSGFSIPSVAQLHFALDLHYEEQSPP